MSSKVEDKASSVAELRGDQASRVITILEGYLSELEQGRPPDHEKLLADHPEMADDLRDYLQKLHMLHQAAAGIRSQSPATEMPPAYVPPERGRLGDFQILREVGRGGMGIVYEAEQISLGRRVALKVLPFASALDSRQLQRFRMEAQAAAHLHHTNIVPVHAVGSDRSVHYYAMQFIEGQTLEALIRQLRNLEGLPVSDCHEAEEAALSELQDKALEEVHPSKGIMETLVRQGTIAGRKSTRNREFFNLVAQIGIQAAAALEHAHQRGIVHRDIKPANLLIDADIHLWITDFGLARCYGEGGLTLTGDVVGTLRYMSPEQALGKRCQIDQRTDIYSLGVTLYELLALQPAFTGRDRQELLQQIAEREPNSLRQRNPAIPIELETIILKAMSKEPECRYSSAHDVADDLTCFLENKPIRARRPGLEERFRRWARRHRPLVFGACGLFLIAVAALVVHHILIMRAHALTEVALAEASEQRQQATMHAANALLRSSEAQSQKYRAEINFRRILVASTQLLQQLEDKRWSRIKEMEGLKRALGEELVRFFQPMLTEAGTEPEARYEAGMAHMLLGDVCRVQGDHARALEQYQRGLGIYQALAAEFPSEAQYIGEYAQANSALGGYYASLERGAEAEASFVKAKALFAQAVPLGASFRLLNNYAWFLCTCPVARLREPAKALEMSQKVVAQLPTCGVSWNTVGVAHYRAGNYADAVAALQKAMDLRTGGDGFDWVFMAMAYWRLGDKDKAQAYFDKTLRDLEKTNIYMEPLLPFLQEAAAELGRNLPKPKALGAAYEYLREAAQSLRQDAISCST